MKSCTCLELNLGDEQFLLKKYNQMLGALGNREFKVKHIGVVSRQRRRVFPVKYKVDQDAFRVALNRRFDAEESELEDSCVRDKVRQRM